LVQIGYGFSFLKVTRVQGSKNQALRISETLKPLTLVSSFFEVLLRCFWVVLIAIWHWYSLLEVFGNLFDREFEVWMSFCEFWFFMKLKKMELFCGAGAAPFSLFFALLGHWNWCVIYREGLGQERWWFVRVSEGKMEFLFLEIFVLFL
jgi:hypothetical protein